jgi:GMP synthase-like glutamine amidotransferase
MKPIALFQHSGYAEPGFVTNYFDEKDVPWVLYRLDHGDRVPLHASGYAGLCFLGGAMSVNDPEPWIQEEVALIKDADRQNIPMVGHCFGSQLMAKTFGATVTRNAVKEIGWGRLTPHLNDVARDWLGDVGASIASFQWHGDTFSLPPGAEHILSSEFCINQAYVIRNLHLGMQSHLEMTPELVRKCAVKGASEIEKYIAAHGDASVQPVERMLEDLDARTREINLTMRRLYDRWMLGVAR